MIVIEYGEAAVPLISIDERDDLLEMREQAIAIFYGWGMPVL